MDSPTGPRPASRCMLLVGSVCLVAFLCADLAFASGRRRTPSPERARQLHQEVLRAATALMALTVQPADANGQVRAWDKRWRKRLERIKRAPIPNGKSCGATEVGVLLDMWASSVTSSRDSLYCGDCDKNQVASLAGEGSRRLALADEASRRRKAGLSCEDMPSLLAVEVDPRLLPGRRERQEAPRRKNALSDPAAVGWDD